MSEGTLNFSGFSAFGRGCFSFVLAFVAFLPSSSERTARCRRYEAVVNPFSITKSSNAIFVFSRAERSAAYSLSFFLDSLLSESVSGSLKTSESFSSFSLKYAAPELILPCSRESDA